MDKINKYDKVIIIDDVSGLADKSENFASFLAVARKFNSTMVYGFHAMYPTKQNW